MCGSSTDMCRKRFFRQKSMTREYSTIIFDLGGVIIDLDKSRCIEAFEKLGYGDISGMLGNYKQSGEFLALEEGRITPAQWRDAVREKVGRPLSDMEIDDAFNAFLVSIPQAKLQMLSALRGKYRIAMLSNTNAVMFEGRIPEMFIEAGGRPMEEYFDDIYVSYRMKMTKPSPDIFRAVSSALGVPPCETLFVDDSAANIAAASQLGFNTLLVEPYTDFSAKLSVK